MLPLLKSKLVFPELPDAVVARPRLADALSAGVHGPVTLVAAPAGWGKTVLLSWWARTGAAGAPVTWLSVEPGDDGRQFWSYLYAAVTGHDAPDSDAEDLAPLADALAGRSEPVVVILDDIHQVRDDTIAPGLEFLLRHAGSRLRLVLAARSDPPLPLHRWRLSGELVEIRTAELSFTVPETALLLAGHGLSVPEARLYDLHNRTEGWPAGLRLAALAARGSADPVPLLAEVSGDSPSIADYLVEEVLAGQPADVREVLLATSILERLTGGLVDAVTGHNGGERILADLERANTFITPLGARPGAYRYHRMFGELLRAELRRTAPERIPDLHRRAARWHAAYDLPIDGVRHALAARDWGYATSVLVEHWHALAMQGHHQTLGTLEPPAPGDAVRADPELALAYAADRLDLNDLHSADRYLRLADQHSHLVSDERRDRFELMRAAFQLAEAQRSGAAERMLAVAPRMLELIGSADDPPAEGARAVALTARGTAQLAAGDAAGAEQTLAAGLAAAERAGLSCPRLVCTSRLAFARAVRGNLRAAERTARTALELPQCAGGQNKPAHRAHAYLALAATNLHWDRLDDAEQHLALAVGTGEASVDPALAASIAILRAHVSHALGDLASGYEALLSGRRGLGEWTAPRQLEYLFAAAEADLRTSHGEAEVARGLLAPLAGEPSASVAVALARIHLRDGDPGAAMRALPAWDTDDGAGLPVRLDAGLLEALAARRLGDGRRASRALERVLQLAEPDGFRLVFTRSGPEVRELLAAHLDSGTAYWYLVRELTAASDDRRPAAPPPPALGEPLTERELTILRYLQSILSNVEIAAELCLSVNTVKTHVRNIYRKLQANRRREAVRRARELHLI